MLYDPIALGAKREHIFALAENIADQVGYKTTCDIRGLVEKIGFKVSYSSITNPSTYSVSMEIKNEKPEIFLDIDTSPLRDRFTIAHEIGHWVLHYLYPKHQLGKTVEMIRAGRYTKIILLYQFFHVLSSFLCGKFRSSSNTLHKLGHNNIAIQKITIQPVKMFNQKMTRTCLHWPRHTRKVGSIYKETSATEPTTHIMMKPNEVSLIQFKTILALVIMMIMFPL